MENIEGLCEKQTKNDAKGNHGKGKNERKASKVKGEKAPNHEACKLALVRFTRQGNIAVPWQPSSR
jgi:hypothetical protein